MAASLRTLASNRGRGVRLRPGCYSSFLARHLEGNPLGNIDVDLWAAAGLLCILSFSFWLTRIHAFAWVSAPVAALFITAAFTNFGALPASGSTPVYGFVFGPGLMAAIFLLLLQVDAGVFRRAGSKMVGLFFLGSAAVCTGVLMTLVLHWIGGTLGETYPTLAGMYAATYTGGSVNFNSVAMVKELPRDGTTFGVAVAIDNVVGSTSLLISVVLAPILARRWKVPETVCTPNYDTHTESHSASPLDLSIAAAAAALAIMLSQWLAETFVAIHQILWLTGISLLAAQTPLGRLGPRVESIAIVLLYLFIAAIGVEVSYDKVVSNGDLAVATGLLAAAGIAVHFMVILLIGRWIVKDPAMILVVSQANIGGPPTALALADTYGRKDLRIPGVAVSLIGYAVGTYLGVAIAAIVGYFTLQS